MEFETAQCSRTPAAGIGAAEGRVALVKVPDLAGYNYQVKRVVREGDTWLLLSENRERSSCEPKEDMVAIALLVDVVSPASPSSDEAD